MDKIVVEGIHLYGYHGCLDEEGIIGTDYTVDVTVWSDLTKASVSDHLNDTLDYVIINRIVTEEMAIRSKLIEHVAKRILDRFLNEMPLLKKVRIKLAKRYPPINGNVEKVSVVMSRKR